MTDHITPLSEEIIELTNALLTSVEQDALGEIGNICMGTSATTLSTLLGKQVNITTPKVSVHSSTKTLGNYEKPFLVVEVSYTEGVDGYNILLMKEDDVKVITNLLMGGDGMPEPDTEIDELHFSAISEVMNQMVGSSATALSNILMKTVNITPPTVKRIMIDGEDLEELICHNDRIIKISFAMEIEGILKSELMQIMQFDFAKSLASVLLGDMMGTEDGSAAEAPAPAPVQEAAAPAPAQAAAPAPAPTPAPAPAQQRPAAPAPRPASAPLAPEQSRVEVSSMEYDSFDEPPRAYSGEYSENIGLIMDVPLQVTVELGKSQRSIKDVLSLGMGSVVVLDRQAGEMVDIMVNGKLYAKGEVVVIDDNYGVRVTDIVATSL